MTDPFFDDEINSDVQAAPIEATPSPQPTPVTATASGRSRRTEKDRVIADYERTVSAHARAKKRADAAEAESKVANEALEVQKMRLDAAKAHPYVVEHLDAVSS